MVSAIKGWYRYLVHRFRRGPAPRGHNRPPVIAGETREDAETGGRWWSLVGLLDRLDDYFKLIEPVRRQDFEAYEMIRQTGASLLRSRGRVFDPRSLPPNWRGADLPAVGAVMFDQRNADDDSISPSFCYIIKIDWHPELQHSRGQIFRVGIAYVKGRHAAAYCFHITVEDGAVRVLKERKTVWQPLPGGSGISHRRWQYSSRLREHLQYLRTHSAEAPPPASVEELGTTSFHLVVQAIDQGQSGAVVRVRQGRAVAAFSIPITRTPAFFKDRDTVVGPEGHKKKIIHIVRTHKRQLADGRETFVKSHFRGMRKFQWNGYDVTVSMPGWHDPGLSSFTSSAVKDPTVMDPDLIGHEEAMATVGAVLDGRAA